MLDAKGERRVFEIESSGTAELIGLNITGGSSAQVRRACAPLVCLIKPTRDVSIAPMELDLALAASQGGGVYVHSNGVAHFEGCNIHDNTASKNVCWHLELS